MIFADDELVHYAAHGTPSLPPSAVEGCVEHDGASLWYAAYGDGPAVVLLHGGLGHSGNWGYQVPLLVEHGYRAIVMDSRGHGRSTRDAKPFRYEQMASDVEAVTDVLYVEKAFVVGWSDGACTGMVLAATAPERVAGVFYFACNMDPSGVKSFVPTPALDRCFARHQQDFRKLSPAPEGFKALVEDLGVMQRTQPDYSSDELARINVPVAIVHAEHDEFILRSHAEYLARTIPHARFLLLEEVSHFAPWQRPAPFGEAMLGFLSHASPASTVEGGTPIISTRSEG